MHAHSHRYFIGVFTPLHRSWGMVYTRGVQVRDLLYGGGGADVESYA